MHDHFAWGYRGSWYVAMLSVSLIEVTRCNGGRMAQGRACILSAPHCDALFEMCMEPIVQT